jgi:hypothetical protein
MLPSEMKATGCRVTGTPEEFEAGRDFTDPRHGIASAFNRRWTLPLM